MKRAIEEQSNQGISITPIAVDKPQKAKAALDLQLKMVTSSVNHEYARIEYDECLDRQRKEDLIEYMSDCQFEYLNAREDLAHIDPYAVQEFEYDLLLQKQRTIGEFHA